MKIGGLLIDVDGTLCLGEEVIPGAIDSVEKIKMAKIPFLILSNNSSMSSKDYLKKMKRLGFDLAQNEILTATEATVRFLNDNHPKKSVMPLGVEGFIEELKKGGINIVDKDPDIVLLAYDKTINFEKLNKASHYIKKRSLFIATHPDIVCNAPDGFDIDIGAFIQLLEESTGKKATIIGKPEKTLAIMAEEKLQLPSKELAVVGDRLYTDIAFANNNGMIAIMVLSGEAKMEDLDCNKYKVDKIIDSIQDIFKIIDYT